MEKISFSLLMLLWAAKLTTIWEGLSLRKVFLKAGSPKLTGYDLKSAASDRPVWLLQPLTNSVKPFSLVSNTTSFDG